MSLTTAQLDAIRRSGQDVCVVAGPGSGKTTVLIERFAWLVEDRGVDPSRILAITFTEKAATEIKERLIKKFAPRFEATPELRESIERAWVSTIDGFCMRVLLENAIAAGLAPDFTVLDQAHADRLSHEAAEEALDEMFQHQPEGMRRLLEALDLSTAEDGRNPDLARSLLTAYESMRVAGLGELPKAAAIENTGGFRDVIQRARELAAIILADRSASGTHVPPLRAFAERFLALPPEVGRGHFEVLHGIAPVHLGRIGKNTRAQEAAVELKNRIAPLLEQQWTGLWYTDVAEFLRAAVSRIDQVFREKKRREGAIDFAGLEEETIRLLEHNPQVRERTASRFDQILMDELQDTNPLQWRLINLLRLDLTRRSFFAVGDINQSIYGFRHAEPAVFAEYRARLAESGWRVDDLRENHRSVAEILDAVSRMLDGQPGIEPRPLIASRESKGGANDGGGPVVELLIGRRNDAADVDASAVEASMVASRIRELCSRGSKFSDIAILVRTLGAAEPFGRALDRFDIPFVVSGGRTFLEAREIRDILGLLAALVNPLDEIALAGVLRGPLVGMSDAEIFRIGREGRQVEFENMFGKLRRMAGFVAPDVLLATALDECGYTGGGTHRARANIEKFLAHIRREHRRRPRPLAELLDDLEALRAAQSEAEAPPPEAGNVVRVMTIHAAKGLEFPVVFVGALHRRTDAHKPVIAFSPTAGLGAKWRHPATGAGQSDRPHQKIVDEWKAKEEAEESRLLYVAMTRAADRLILSFAEGHRASSWQKLAESAGLAVTEADRLINPADAADSVGTGAPAEELLDPPAIASRRDAAAAVTSIALFHACPRKFLLSSITSGQPPRQGGSNLEEKDGYFENTGDDFADDYRGGGLAFGAAVHRILAGGADGEATDLSRAAELASRFAGSELGRRAARATRIEREFDFLFYFEDVVLRGQIDLWFEEDGELIVVDYKTDHLPDDQESPEAYGLQLQIYALALKPYAGRVADRAALHYLRSDKVIDVPIDPETARGAVRAFLQAQDSLDYPMKRYPMKPGEQCRRCGFFRNSCVGIGVVDGTVDRAAG